MRAVVLSTTVLAVSLVLAPPTRAQAVLVVDAAGGPGSGYTTIGAAVAAANNGDFLLVRSGFYAETVTLDGKGLSLQAETGANVSVVGITVRNLAANQHAAVRGIGRTSDDLTITLEHDRGQVWLEDLDPPLTTLFLNVTLAVNDCDTVVVRNCNFKPINPQPAVRLTSSTIALYQCAIEGQAALSSPFPIDGTAGISALSSSATLYASTVVGGHGSAPLFGGSPGSGGPGCTLESNSVLDVIGSSVQGGPGGTGGSPGQAFLTLSGSVVHQLPNLAHTLTTSSPVREGTTTSLTLTGHPGDHAFVLVGPVPGPYTTGASVVGPLVIGAPRFSLAMGVLPGSGVKTVNLGVPLIASLSSSFYLQGLFVGAGEVALGSATQLHVLDAGL